MNSWYLQIMEGRYTMMYQCNFTVVSKEYNRNFKIKYWSSYHSYSLHKVMKPQFLVQKVVKFHEYISPIFSCRVTKGEYLRQNQITKSQMLYIDKLVAENWYSFAGQFKHAHTMSKCSNRTYNCYVVCSHWCS